MKRIRRSRVARAVSWVLTVAMLAPMACRMIGPDAAYAQTPVATGLQTAVVIDFVNKAGFLGEALARRATDAVAVELANSARFEVLRRDEVERQAATLGLKRPYDRVAQDRLAAAFGATAIVTGEVSFVNTVAKSDPKRVLAGLKVMVRAPGSQELVNGAAQVGEVRGRPGQSDDESLAQEAVDNAAVLAVKQILSTNLPDGTIVSTVGPQSSLQILVNRGSRDGVQAGQQMLVTREGQRVGKIQITNVFSTDSEAKVVENTLGIRPEDKVRAIMAMPVFAAIPGVKGIKTEPAPARGSVASLGKVLVVLAAGVVIAAAVMGGKNTSVTGVTAEADVEGVEPTVRITWRDNFWGATTLEHQIWRVPDAPYNFQGEPIASKQYEPRYVDRAAPYSYWDGTRSFLRAPLPGTGGGTGNNGGTEAEVVTPEAGAVPGFTVGRTYTYALTAVIRRPLAVSNTGGNQGGGGNNQVGTEDVGTSPVPSGSVTPIAQPLLVMPENLYSNVDLTRFNPTWMSTTGADVFVVEVSTDRTFKNKSLILQLPRVYSTAPLATGVTQVLGSAVDLTTNPVLLKDPVFANYVNRVPGAAKPTIYWRVGGRNDEDRPGPVHWITRNHADGDRTFRYVYSEVRSFTPADMPPPPP
ncbi:MAG: hypothetical protein GX446_01745 [Chthonomonadales bacterium]|nr:hypothetical protein [Chthonomonadales bacterium]